MEKEKVYFGGITADEYEELREPQAKDWRERMRNAATFWLCVAIVCGILAIAGCASTADKPKADPVRFLFVCAFVKQTEVHFDGNPEKYPAAHMVCDRQ